MKSPKPPILTHHWSVMGTLPNPDQTHQHWGAKANAPEHHTSRPDVGKLARSTTDAITSILWRDDAQIVKETHSKAYGNTPGVTVIVREAETKE